MKVGSLFSGVGGLDLGLERAGMRVLWHAEIDPYCRGVLADRWPDSLIFDDVRAIGADAPPVDLICGGFPCPPFSSAGLRRGIEDERWLWPEFERVLRLLRPRYALVENVPDLVTSRPAFGRILGDLHELGFDAEWSIVSACSLGATHLRRRLFVLAYPAGNDGPGALPRDPQPIEAGSDEPRGSGRRWGRDGWLPEPAMDRVADGVPHRLVRPPLEALGNAVVPQVAEWIGWQIMRAAADERVAGRDEGGA